MTHPVLQLIDVLEEGLLALDEERHLDAAAAFQRGEAISQAAASAVSDATGPVAAAQDLTEERLAYARRLHAVCAERIVAERDAARSKLNQVAMQGRARRLYRAYGG